MRVLVVGGGGREHAIAWKLSQSCLVDKIFIAPGNGGTRLHGENVPIKDSDIDKLAEFAQENNIDLTIVGPEASLVEGIVDTFQEKGLKIFGPSKEAAKLEGSKVFAKKFMEKYNIPTADFSIVTSKEEAEEKTKKRNYPYVIKVDGLAAGKGAYVVFSEDDKKKAFKEIWEENKFGKSANRVIIEDFLDGEELSVFALTDGENYILLPPAQDHKRVFDNDQGPNTGGMGAYSPSPLATGELLQKIEKMVIQPTLKGMKEIGHPYKGVLYCGLMIADDKPYVLEFNCRFGDPEAQVIIPPIKTDFAELLLKVVEGKLNEIDFELTEQYTVCVVMASGGYPGSYKKGIRIEGLPAPENFAHGVVFHAGTKFENGEYFTSGGRVLGVTCWDETLKGAVDRAYKVIQTIHFDGAHFRKDIARKGLKRLGVL
ncbi:MAG: phosphoribosylamine--glycine ligase [Candidatus Neomarinimicrobiota bacterium]|nr:MAG: phosphoribosylamine--glycine ligase [Candidatus Neomarinimicrobiota bacterium]